VVVGKVVEVLAMVHLAAVEQVVLFTLLILS
jgi:hypothetical protein